MAASITTFGNELQNQFNGNQVLGFGAIDPPPAGWGTPNITFTVFSPFGTSVGGPFVTNDHTFQWVDSLAWSKGKHSFKFGAEIRRDQFNEAGNQDLRGQFTVNGNATGTKVPTICWGMSVNFRTRLRWASASFALLPKPTTPMTVGRCGRT